MKALIIKALSVSLLLMSAAPAADDIWSQIYDKSSPSVVQLVAYPPNGASLTTGTGFVIDSAGLLVTNSHVIQGAAAVNAQLSDGTMRPCLIVDQTPEYDLALLKLSSAASSPKIVFPIKLLEGQSPEPHEPEEVMVISNPFKLQNTVLVGRMAAKRNSRYLKEIGIPVISRDDCDIYQIDVSGAHGVSGGPIIDKTGSVVAVLTAAKSPGESQFVESRFVFCVPIKYLSRLKRDAVAKPFSPATNLTHLNPGGGATRLSYTVVNEKNVSPVRRSSNLGYVGKIAPVNLFQTVASGPAAEKMNSFLGALHLLPNLIANESLVRVVNPYYSWTLLVPERFKITEIDVPPDPSQNGGSQDIENMLGTTFENPANNDFIKMLSLRLAKPSDSDKKAQANIFEAITAVERSFIGVTKLGQWFDEDPATSDMALLGKESDTKVRFDENRNWWCVFRRYKTHFTKPTDFLAIGVESGSSLLVAVTPIIKDSSSKANDPDIEAKARELMLKQMVFASLTSTFRRY
jgi:hypothetical protein